MNEEEFKKFLEFGNWLANDCGGCDTCISLFTKKDHERYWELFETLTEEQKAMLEPSL